jgi:GeoRSP system SPASM domain protein
LKAGGCRTTVLCQGGRDELEALESSALPDEVLLDAGPFTGGQGIDAGALAETLDRLRAAGCDPGLAFVPAAGKLEFLPGLADLCRALGISRFKLPNLRIDDSLTPPAGGAPLRPGDIVALRESLGNLAGQLGRGLHLEVHDLFLWEVLFPEGGGERSEYGGCQAGNSLGYVNAAGTLFPCTSWPEAIGSLLTVPLTDLWACKKRYGIRERIRATPAGCVGCRDLPVCFGGCRGLALCGYGNQGRDPGCAGPR